MTRIGRRVHPLVIFLGVLAAAQATLLVWRWASAGDGVGFLAAGADLAALEIERGSGVRASLASGHETVLLVFHSLCGHCDRVAPAWRDWLAGEGRARRVLAISAEPLEVARRFAEDHGWDVDVGSAPGGSRSSLAAALTRRTPWVFVLDPAGRVVAEGHGDRLAELGAPPRTGDVP